MNIISRLVKEKGREKRVRVFLDGKYACTLLAVTVIEEGLGVGQELSDGQLEALTGQDLYQRCLNTALRYLGCRPRSEAEIRQRLQRRGYDCACTEKVLSRLKEQGLADDAAFARFWIENRESFSPRSRRLAGLELRRKGLNRDIIEQATGEMDDRNSAYRAALGKGRRLSTNDYNDFRRRLAGYLVRRGFGYDVINETINTIWQERGSPEPSLLGQDRRVIDTPHPIAPKAREY